MPRADAGPPAQVQTTAAAVAVAAAAAAAAVGVAAATGARAAAAERLAAAGAPAALGRPGRPARQRPTPPRALEVDTRSVDGAERAPTQEEEGIRANRLHGGLGGRWGGGRQTRPSV